MVPTVVHHDEPVANLVRRCRAHLVACERSVAAADVVEVHNGPHNIALTKPGLCVGRVRGGCEVACAHACMCVTACVSVSVVALSPGTVTLHDDDNAVVTVWAWATVGPKGEQPSSICRQATHEEDGNACSGVTAFPYRFFFDPGLCR